MATDSPEFYNLKWDSSHQRQVLDSFWALLGQETLTDCTLVCSAPSESVQVHRLILSANSPYFRGILKSHESHPHPIIILPDVELTVLKMLVTFMYRGEINIPSSHFPALLKTAESLQIMGLSRQRTPSSNNRTTHYSKKARILEQQYAEDQYQEEPLELKSFKKEMSNEKPPSPTVSPPPPPPPPLTPPPPTSALPHCSQTPPPPTSPSSYSNPEELSCPYCTTSPPYFPTHAALSEHLSHHHQQHHGNCSSSQILCKFCSKPFPEVSELIRHLPVHTGERPFKCSFCGKAFKLRHHMKDHARVHTGERPFRCSMCGKTFSRSTILKAHEKTHFKDPGGGGGGVGE